MMIDLDNSTIDMVNLYVDATGKIKATNAEISGTITGSGLISTGTHENVTLTTTINEGIIETNSIKCKEIDGDGTRDVTIINGFVNANHVICNIVECTTLNGGVPVTDLNMSQYSSGGVANSGHLGLFTISINGGFISYQDAAKDNTSGFVYIGAQTLQAGTIQQISLRESKDKIEMYEKSAIDLIYNTPIHTYVLKDNKEDAKTHVGVLIDEAPEDIIGAGGTTISLYDMISLGWKGEQEIIKRLLKIEGTLDKNGIL
jgi:hypothetical protein